MQHCTHASVPPHESPGSAPDCSGSPLVMASTCNLLSLLSQLLLFKLALAGGPVVTSPSGGNVYTTDPIPGPAAAPIPARFLAPAPAVSSPSTAASGACLTVCLNGGVPVVRTEGRDCLCQCPTVGNTTFM